MIDAAAFGVVPVLVSVFENSDIIGIGAHRQSPWQKVFLLTQRDIFIAAGERFQAVQAGIRPHGI
jgi:hypothetical protein